MKDEEDWTLGRWNRKAMFCVDGLLCKRFNIEVKLLAISVICSIAKWCELHHSSAPADPTIVLIIKLDIQWHTNSAQTHTAPLCYMYLLVEGDWLFNSHKNQ